jgi:hypothetical protein
MTFVAHTRALMFDLRENAGGAPSMVVLLASFLFGEPVHLTTITGRPGAPGRENWTFADVPGPPAIVGGHGRRARPRGAGRPGPAGPRTPRPAGTFRRAERGCQSARPTSVHDRLLS